MSVVTVIGVLIIALVGCTQPGYLEVENNTGAAILVEPEGKSDEDIPDGNTETWSWDLEASPLNTEEIEVDVAITGWYKISETVTRTIRPGQTTEIAVGADGGLFILENDGPYTITTLGIATSQSEAESRDDDTVAVGGFTSWTLGGGSRWYFYINDGCWYNTLYWDCAAGDQITVTWYGETWSAADARLTAQSATNAISNGSAPQTADAPPVVGAQKALVE